MITIEEFIDSNRTEIDVCIRRVCASCDIDDDERDTWINNDEGLYNWARSEGVDV